MAPAARRQRLRPRRSIRSGRTHEARQQALRFDRRLGLGPMARHGPETLRQGRILHQRMRHLPRPRAQQRLRLHHAPQRPTVRLPMNKLFLSAVLSISLLGCTSTNPRVVTRFNESASLTGDLPANPLQWKIITSAIDKQDSTMYTLFGNDIAVQY